MLFDAYTSPEQRDLSRNGVHITHRDYGIITCKYIFSEQ